MPAQVEDQDRLVDLHPSTPWPGETTEDLAVGAQQAVQQVESPVELGATWPSHGRSAGRSAPATWWPRGLASSTSSNSCSQLWLELWRLNFRDRGVMVGVSPAVSWAWAPPQQLSSLTPRAMPKRVNQGWPGRRAPEALGDHAEGQQMGSTWVIPGGNRDRQQLDTGVIARNCQWARGWPIDITGQPRQLALQNASWAFGSRSRPMRAEVGPGHGCSSVKGRWRGFSRRLMPSRQTPFRS